MTTMQTEVYEAFRDLGASEDKAVKAAAALARRDAEVSDVKRDTAVIKWMIGFMLAMQVATLWKLFA